MTVLWILTATVVFLILHRALENIFLASGGTTHRRKLLWDFGTAGVFVLGIATLWALVILNWNGTGQYLTLLFFLTPLALAGIGVFLYVSKLAYDEDENDARTG